jgi:hypothetical protein
MVSFLVNFGPLSSYEVATAGLQVTPGSGFLYAADPTGMGTSAIGNVLSIQSGTPNESIIFQVFRSNGLALDLGAPEGATDVTLFVGGLPTTTQFELSAEDKDGNALGGPGPTTTTVGNGTIDVSALIPGAIHKLTIEATTNNVSIKGIDYTAVCLGYTP